MYQAFPQFYLLCHDIEIGFFFSSVFGKNFTSPVSISNHWIVSYRSKWGHIVLVLYRQPCFIIRIVSLLVSLHPYEIIVMILFIAHSYLEFYLKERQPTFLSNGPQSFLSLFFCCFFSFPCTRLLASQTVLLSSLTLLDPAYLQTYELVTPWQQHMMTCLDLMSCLGV